jgi:ABC-type multidrug transport system permease subunit
MAVKLEFVKQPKPMLWLMDSLLMIKRSSMHIVRNTDQLLGTFLQPIMFLVLFAGVFGGAMAAALPPDVSYLNFLLPGIIIQTAAFGSTTTAIAVANDMQRGIIDRFRSLPMANLAVLNGHVVSDLFRNVISSTIMILAGLAIGFRSQASVNEWLLITLLILLFTFAMSWLSAIMGLIAKSVEGVQWISFMLIFPLTMASTAFVPITDKTNAIVKAFAENQPISHIVETFRAFILGNPVGDHLWISIVWCIGTILVAMPLASWLFRRKTSH